MFEMGDWHAISVGSRGGTPFLADRDHDGDVDMFVIRRNHAYNTDDVTLLYFENEGGIFQTVSTNLLPGRRCLPNWVDVDQDGVLDVISCVLSGTNWQLRAYEDTGTALTLMSHTLPLDGHTDLMVTDTNSDGIPDLITSEKTVLHGDGVFFSQGELPPGILSWSREHFFDFDGDGRLDYLTNNVLYLNHSGVTNTPPPPPDVTATQVGAGALLSRWLPQADLESGLALTYDMRIGTTPGGNDVLPGNWLSGDTPLISGPGRLGATTAYRVRHLRTGVPYYVAVRAVDVGHLPSAWAEIEFTLENYPPEVRLLAPLGETPVSNSPELRFRIEDEGEAGFRVQVAPDAEFSDLLVDYEASPALVAGQLEMTFHIGQRAEGGAYVVGGAGQELPLGVLHWRVQATDEEGLRSSWVADSFTVPLLLRHPEWEAVAVDCLAYGDITGNGFLDGIRCVRLSSAAPLDQDRYLRVYRNEAGVFTPDLSFGEVLCPGNISGAVLWDMDGDGDLDVLLASSHPAGETWIYRNEGGVFVRMEDQVLPPSGGNIDMADVDNDGDLDLWLGNQLFIREGERFVLSPHQPGPLPSSARAVFVDINLDGSPDLLVSADEPASGSWTKIYINRGGVFELSQVVPVGSGGGDLKRIDLDVDGDIDVIACGDTHEYNVHSSRVFWVQEGNVTQERRAYGASDCHIATGDVNGDGSPDYTLQGYVSYEYRKTPVFLSTGDGGFLPEDTLAFDFWSGRGRPRIHDFNGDGKLDLLLRGPDTSGAYRAYINNRPSFMADLPPSGPGHPTIMPLDGGGVRMGWAPAHDDHTPSPGLGYRLRVGSAPGGMDILAASAAADGTRTLDERGLPGGRLEHDLFGIQPGVTVYWAVQAIDAAFQGSAWTEGPSLLVEPRPPHVVPLSPVGLFVPNGFVEFKAVSRGTAGGWWEIIVTDLATGDVVLEYRSDELEQTYEVVRFQVGQDEESGGYLTGGPGQRLSPGQYRWAVRGRLGDMVTPWNDRDGEAVIAVPFLQWDAIKDLSSGKNAQLRVVDVDRDGRLDLVVAHDSGVLIAANRPEGFVDVTAEHPELSELLPGRAQLWSVDLHNSGWADLVISAQGYPNHSGTYDSLPVSFSAGTQVALLDLDNDGAWDAVGEAASSFNRGGEFVPDLDFVGFPTDLPGHLTGRPRRIFLVADFDLDMDQDVLVVGMVDWTNVALPTPYSRLYWNEDGRLQEGAAFVGVTQACAAVLDYDQDGAPDVVISGADLHGRGRIAFYRNDGSGGFTRDEQAHVPAMWPCSLAVGDVDGDGDPDIVFSGFTDQTNAVTLLFLNEDGVFHPFNEQYLVPLGAGELRFGDLDQDNRLDLIVSGETWDGNLTRVHMNHFPDVNTSPSPPSSVAVYTTSAGDLRVEWEAGTDFETPSSALSYNLCVGTEPERCDILSPLAEAGLLYRPQAGNVGSQRRWRLRSLDPATPLYVRVQTVDTGYLASGWSDVVFVDWVNHPPQAVIVAPESLTAGEEGELNGSGSYDLDGPPISHYEWTQLEGPPVAVTDATAAVTSFTAPDVESRTPVAFSLVVSNEMQTSAPATTEILILPPNQPPQANAGADQEVIAGDVVALDGSGSFDPDGDPLTALWEQIAGEPVLLQEPSALVTSFRAPEVRADSTLVFLLTVVDSRGGWSDDQTTVQVIRLNRVPVAVAGGDQVVDEHERVELDGSASYDPDHDELSYQWTQALGPTVVLEGAASTVASFVVPELGGTDATFVFRLIVNDGMIDSAPDTVSVFSRAINDPPVASAGPHQTVLCGDLVFLDGSGSHDPEGQPLTLFWRQEEGLPVVLSDTGSPSPWFRAPSEPGRIVFALEVSDGVLLDEDAVVVTVLRQPELRVAMGEDTPPATALLPGLRDMPLLHVTFEAVGSETISLHSLALQAVLDGEAEVRDWAFSLVSHAPPGARGWTDGVVFGVTGVEEGEIRFSFVPAVGGNNSMRIQMDVPESAEQARFRLILDPSIGVEAKLDGEPITATGELIETPWHVIILAPPIEDSDTSVGPGKDAHDDRLHRTDLRGTVDTNGVLQADGAREGGDEPAGPEVESASSGRGCSASLWAPVTSWPWLLVVLVTLVRLFIRPSAGLRRA
jgi:hypothetical protein